MIAGVGIDVVDIKAFSQQLETPGSVFAKKVFTAREMRYARRRAERITRVEASAEFASTGSKYDEDFATTLDLAQHLAARWAAKEAFIKAWSGALYGSEPPLSEEYWGSIEVTNDRWGRPAIILGAPVAGSVHKTLGNINTHVSLSHDGNVATALVIIEYQKGNERRPLLQ